MKHIIPIAIAIALFVGASAHAESIEILPNGGRPSARGSAQTFSGSVIVDPLFGVTDYTRATGGHVTFEPGARSAWHSHPAGQILIVTSGVGWVQQWGGEKRQIGPGDVVWTPPGVKHWHGATATNGMSHIAIQEQVEGKVVEWMEQVSEEQYRN
jgi:quercetin dioxygenase-like cupin family protein